MLGLHVIQGRWIYERMWYVFMYLDGRGIVHSDALPISASLLAVVCGHNINFTPYAIGVIEKLNYHTISPVPILLWIYISSTTSSIHLNHQTSSPCVSYLGSNPTMTHQPSSFWIETEDWHTAGEPFRIVKDLPPDHLPSGPTVSQRRQNVINTPNHRLDTLRKSLCHEPRGHADMYGGFIVPPNDSGAYLGVLFWHKDGFSTACGHGTIALGYWAVTSGLVDVPKEGEKEVDVIIDVPSGRVVAKVMVQDGKPVRADFVNVASYQLAKGIVVSLPSIEKEITLDLSFGGAVYASVFAEQFGLRVEPQNVDAFIHLGREIKKTLGIRGHYGEYDLYGVMFVEEEDSEGDERNSGDIIKQRSVTVFADGQIDRSPCGSGTAARLAILLAEGRMNAGRGKLVHHSIIDSVFEADILKVAESPVEGFPGCVPRVRGRAGLVGYMKFFIDEDDPIYPGFLLR